MKDEEIKRLRRGRKGVISIQIGGGVERERRREREREKERAKKE